MSEYEEAGFENRRAYLESLAEEHGVPIENVLLLAQLLGRNEDFDGLVTNLEDESRRGGLA